MYVQAACMYMCIYQIANFLLCLHCTCMCTTFCLNFASECLWIEFGVLICDYGLAATVFTFSDGNYWYCCCDLMADFSTSLLMLLTDQGMPPVTQKSDSKHKTHTLSLSLSPSLSSSFSPICPHPSLTMCMSYCHDIMIFVLLRVQNQVSNVIGIMKDNISRVMDRGEKLEALEEKSGKLHVGLCAHTVYVHCSSVSSPIQSPLPYQSTNPV